MATKPRAKMVQRDATLDDLLKSGARYQQFAEDHPAEAAPTEPSGMARRVLGDGGIALLKGAIGVPEAAVGLADLATGGAAGKMLENEGGAVGFRPKMAKQFLDTYKSPEQQAADKAVGEAQGFVDTTVAALKNPSVVLGSVAESIPVMLGGGVVARALMRGGATIAGAAGPMRPGMLARVAGADAAPVIAGAAGEGIVAAGSSAEAIRQETPDGLLTGEQSGLAAASGLATGFLGYLGGKVAQRLGIADIDTVLAGKAGPEVTKGFTRRVLEGAVSEGLLEELPQSVQEQVAQNMALGRPLGEGVPQAAVLGALAGGLMGGGGNAISYGGQVRREKVDGTGAASRAINAGLEDTAQQADAIQAAATPPVVDPLAAAGAAPAAAAPTEPVSMGAPIEPAAMPPEQPAAEPAVPRPITEGRKINLDGKDWIVTTRPQGGYSITNGAETRSVPAAAKTGKRIAELLAGGPAAPAVAPAAPVPTAAPAPVSDSQAFADADIPLPDQAAPPAPMEATMAAPVEPAAAPAPTPPAADGAEWQTFEPETGTKNVPRADMPQIRAEHRGAMVQFLKGRGILHEQETEVDAAGLKPTQAEYSMAKVQKAREFSGGNRAILVSNDGHVLDGHHQWLAAATDGKPLRVIRLDAPIDRLLAEVKEFPSATTDTASAPAQATPAAPSPAVAAPAPAAEPIIEHVTGKGKTLRGVIRRMPEAEAKAMDPGTFKKNGGWFIRASRAGLSPERLEEIADTPLSTEGTDEATRPQAQAAAGESAAPAAAPAPAPAPAQPTEGPGSDAGNGFKQGPKKGERYRVGVVASVGGAVSLEKRLPAGTAATFYIGKDGNLIDGDSVNLIGDGKDRLWIPATPEQAQQAQAILDEMGRLELNDPARKDAKARLKALVQGKPTQEPNEAARPQAQAAAGETNAPAAAPAPAAPAVVPGTGPATNEAGRLTVPVRTFGSSGYQLTMAQALAKVKELEADARRRKTASTKAPTAIMRGIEEDAASRAATLARKLREDIKQTVSSYPDARAEYAEARGEAQPASVAVEADGVKADEPWKLTREQAAKDYPGDEYDKMINRAADLGDITYDEAAKISRINSATRGRHFWAKTRKQVEADNKAAVKAARDERADFNKMKPSEGYAAWRIRANNVKNKAAVESAIKYGNDLLAVHKERVQEALDEGKDVPAEVLADYPDLKRPAATPNAEAPVQAAPRGAEAGTAVSAPDADDYLTQLFGTPAEQAASQDRLMAGIAQRKQDTERIRDAIGTEKKRAQADYDDWSSRTYKRNKTQVDLQGDGPSNQGSMSIGAINESRRRNAMEALSQELKALDKLGAAVATDSGAEQFMAAMRDLYARAEKIAADGNGLFKTPGEQFQYMLLDDLKFRGPAGKGNVTSNGLSKAVLSAVKPDATPAPTLTPKAQAVKEALAAKKGAQPATVATHKDPGEPAEPVTPAVVREAIKTGVQATDRKPSAMKAELLAKIDAAMETASSDEADERQLALARYPARKPTKDEVRTYMVQNRLNSLAAAEEKMVAERERSARNNAAAVAERIGYVTFSVPGDGVFKVVNTRDRLAEFRRKVEGSGGFKDRQSAPTPDRDGSEKGSGSKLAAFDNMVNEGDLEAASDYADAVGLELDPKKVANATKVLKWRETRPAPAPEAAAQPEAEAPASAAAPAEQAAAILNAAAEPPKGKERLDVLKDVKAGAITPEEVAAAYPPSEAQETTDAQRQQAADHAKDLGGRVVWQRGDLALIEGYSLLSGDSVYIAANGSQRTRVDIQSYTGKGYTEAQKAELMKARADAVRAADELLARNPDGPFANEPLVFASDIPAAVQGVVRGWIDLLGLDGARIVVTTPASGAAMADGMAGKFRRIGKASLSGDNTNGTMQPLGGDDFHIAVRPGVSTLKALEVMAHELGHIVERRAFAQASAGTQQAIRDAHAAWLKENGSGRALDMAQAMRAYRSGQTTGFSEDAKALEAGAYWRSFGEWFADQVSRWATTEARPVGVVEQFFKRLAARLRGFFTGERAKFKPNTTVAQWLDSLAKDVPPAEEVAAAYPAAEPVAEKPAKQPAAKIGDFGEKLEGARKDYATTLKDAEDVDVSAEPLSKSWPEPDYQKLLDGGADPFVVAFIHAARDEVPTKPQKSWKLKGWVESVQTLRGAARGLLDGSISRAQLDSKLTLRAFDNVRRNVGSRAELYQLVGHDKSLKGITFAEHQYSLYKGQSNVRKWVVEQKAKATMFSNWPRELAVADTKEEMLQQFRARFAEPSATGKNAPAKGKFSVYTKRKQEGVFIGKKIGREYIDLKKLPDIASARKFLDENTAELETLLEKYKETPFERNPENQPRVGDDHRNGAPVTPKIFEDTFGFRGVQFGNYVEQARRQSDLNQGFDSLMDLAAVLGVPPRALSLNGRLGLAFGARGKGGTNAPAAHYEPGNVVINLTKNAGPGSLAHEWWHAVDNYFGKNDGGAAYGTGGTLTDKTRAAMRLAFNEVKSATQQGTLRRRAMELDKRKSKPYWDTPIELSARSFESYVIAKLKDQGAANDYLANVVSKEFWDAQEALRAGFLAEGKPAETYPYPTPDEVPAVRNAFDNFFRVVETRADDAGNVALFSRAPGIRPALDAAIAAKEAFDAYDRKAVQVEDADQFFALSEKATEARDALAAKLLAQPDDGFALQGRTIRGRMVIVNGSAQNPGQWQLTRFDGNDEPWGDSQYRTKESALTDFLREIDLTTLQDMDGMFSRAEPGRAGVPMADAKAVVATIREALPTAPEIVLHDSVRRAPENLRRLIRQAGADNDVEAVYHDGEIHVFPGNIPSIERMQFVVAHHEVRHHGIRSRLGTGDELGAAMHAMWAGNQGLRKAAQAKIDAGLASTRALAVEEALADMPVEEIAKLKGYQRVIAAVRQWLRQVAARLRTAKMPTLADMVEPKTWTDADVANFVLRAEGVSRGDTAVFRAGGTVFGRGQAPGNRGSEADAIAAGFTMKAYRGVSAAEPFNDTGTTWMTTSREVAEAYAEEVMGYDDPAVLEVMVKPDGLPRHDASRLTDEQREALAADDFGNPQAVGIYDRSDDHPLGGSRRNVTVIHAPKEAVWVVDAGGAAFSRADQTQTPAFRRWFGDSKVVDAQGKPLVVYHGTRGDFSTFRDDKGRGLSALQRLARSLGIGENSGDFFFAADPEFASGYAGLGGKMTGGNIMPVYLSIKSPAYYEQGVSSGSLGAAMEKAKRDGRDGIIVRKWDEAGAPVSDVYIAFDARQIKSTIGNSGAFDPASPSIVADLSRVGDQVARQGYERADVKRMQAARRLQGILADKAAGKLTPEEFDAAVEALADQMADVTATKAANRLMTERQRGADMLRVKLINARRTGDLDPDAVGLGLWLLDKNPDIASDLSVSILSPKDGSPAGDYNPVTRVIRLFKDMGNADTIAHEILHHAERMMPPELQAPIRAEWAKQVEASLKAAKDQPAVLAALQDMLAAAAGNRDAYQRTVQAFKDGVLDYGTHYQLFNQSEFWAVNGARILSGRYGARGSWVAQAGQWLRDLVQYIRGALGLRSDAPVLRALANVTDPANFGVERGGDFASQDMLSQGDDVRQSLGFAEASERALSVKGKASNVLAHYRGMAMQTLGRRQIIDLWAKDIPALAPYGQFVERMDAEKNDTAAEADELANRWGKLPDERQLAELMHDATLAHLDADTLVEPADDEPYDEVRLIELRRAFEALTPEAQKTYREARDAYKEHHAKVRLAIRERIERAEMSPERRRKLLEKMDNEFFKKVRGVYFPLSRFGSYVVVVRDSDGEAVTVSRAETINEAEATRAELLKNFPAADGYRVGKVIKDREFNAARDGVGRGFMAELFETLEKQGAGEDLSDAIGQLYLASLPDLSWAKHGIHRKGTPGFSQDARRAFAQNSFHGARYLAKLRYADRLQTQLTDMQKQVDSQRDVEGFDSIKGQQVVDEMVKRHETLMNPKANPLSTALTSFGFIFHLGLSPASALVNLSQTALVAFPQMAAKWGYNRTAAMLLTASREAASNRNDISKVLQGDELRAYEEAVRIGAIDVTQAHDLAGIAQGEDSKVAWKLRPVMKWASFMFHHAERFNRQVTFVAAYRLAREAGAGHSLAFEQAVKSTYDGHFDYSASNRPRIMQGNVAKVLLLFKQFGQNMVYTISRQAYLSMQAETPTQRAEARKALGGLLAMHAAGAGALGLPLVSTLLAAASMLGGGDDEPWDAEVALRNTLADAFGVTAADVMARGLSRLTPWDISGRVGLDRLILPDVQEGLEGARAAESWMTAALGPVAGIAVGFAKGMQAMSEGNTALGMEAMLPSALRGPLRAMRYADEGAIDKTGIPIKDDVSAAGIAGQALGLAPTEVRLATEGKSAIYQRDRALLQRRQQLMTQYAMAAMAGDQEGVQEARQDIQGFNAKNPKRAIQPENLRASVAARRRRIEQADQGVYLPKNRREATEAGRFALEQTP